MRWGRGAMVVRAVAVVVAGVLVVAGCSGDPGPTTTPVVTSTPTVEPTPAPEPEPAPETVLPERPAAMDDVDADGAEAAVTYFLSLYPYVYATGDLEEWRELSHPECVFCTSVIDNVEANTAAGKTAPGATLTIENPEVEEVIPEHFRITAIADQGAADRLPAQLTVMVFADESGWTVREVEVDEAPS